MTSHIRSFGSPKEGLTRFLKVESMAYDTLSTYVLFPFVYRNGQLDITYEGNNFKERMIDISGQSPNELSRPSVRILGGPRLVTSIGPNFKNYIRAWRAATIDENSPIEVYIPGQTIRVQEAANQVNSDGDDVYSINVTAPSGENFVTGNASDRYRSTFVLKTPLVLTILEGGVKQYVTFKTKFDQEADP